MNKIEEDKKVEIIKETIENKLSIDLQTTDLDLIKEKLNFLDNQANVIRDNLVEGINNDYSVIPGTGAKPSLLLPGARKIALMFGLITKFEIIEKDVKNEPFTWKDNYGREKENQFKVRYLVKATLTLINGNVVAESFGGANNQEKKSREMNENNILKIAQKRAFVGAILQISNLSKLFTQDTEDMETKGTTTKLSKVQVSNDIKKERFAIYSLIQKKEKLTQQQTKERVREIINLWNEKNETSFKTILDFDEDNFKKLMEEF